MKGLHLMVSIVLGAILWFLGGWIVSMVCLQLPVEQLHGNESLFTAFWFFAARKVAIAWSFMGGFLGLVTSLVFMTRPKHEHFTSIMGIPMRSVPPGFTVTPVSIAQVRSVAVAVFLGFLLSLLGVVYFLPSLENEMIMIASLPIRIFVAAITSFAFVYPISSYSLWIVLKFKERR